MVSAIVHVTAGWAFWSLAHHLGHRWWHDDMKKGKDLFYAHGERQHHRFYDNHDRARQIQEDPLELFISFPFKVVAPAALLPIGVYGLAFGWAASVPFGLAVYASMILDHEVHKLCHRRPQMDGILGWFQRMHDVHHQTHTRNFFFVSGLVWDAMFGTLDAGSTPQPSATHQH